MNCKALFIVMFVSLNLFSSSSQLAAQELTVEEQELDSLLREAITSTERSNFNNSLKLYQQVIHQAEEIDSHEYLILGYLNFGILYWRINKSEQALQYYFKALDISKENGIVEHLNSIYNNIGVVYSRNNEKDKAIENFRAALDISKKLNNQLKVAINLINISNIYSDYNENDSALSCLYEAKNIIEEEGEEQRFLAVIHNNIGERYNDQNKNNDALVHFKKALSTADTSDIYYYAIFLHNIGNTFYLVNEYDSAMHYLNRSLQLALRLKNKEYIIRSYSLLADVYQKTGSVHRSLEYYKKSLAWKDSLLQERSQKWISEMQMKYEFGKKEEEVKFLERKNKLNVIIWILSVSVLFIISFFIIYSFRNKHIKTQQRNELLRKEKEVTILEKEKTEAENKFLHEEITATEEINRIKQEKLKEKLQHKNRELTSQAMYVVNKNQILDDINSKIIDINPDHISDTKQKLNEMKMLIKSNISIENDWNNFKIHFEEVHKRFFQKLKSTFPDLSQSDLRHCAYIVLNMTNKEIAQIFNISPDSVRKRKQRLREKMQLEKDTELIDYLNQFGN